MPLRTRQMTVKPLHKKLGSIEWNHQDGTSQMSRIGDHQGRLQMRQSDRVVASVHFYYSWKEIHFRKHQTLNCLLNRQCVTKNADCRCQVHGSGDSLKHPGRGISASMSPGVRQLQQWQQRHLLIGHWARKCSTMVIPEKTHQCLVTSGNESPEPHTLPRNVRWRIGNHSSTDGGEHGPFGIANIEQPQGKLFEHRLMGMKPGNARFWHIAALNRSGNLKTW